MWQYFLYLSFVCLLCPQSLLLCYDYLIFQFTVKYIFFLNPVPSILPYSIRNYLETKEQHQSWRAQVPALCNLQPSSVQPRVTSPCRDHSLITSCRMNKSCLCQQWIKTTNKWRCVLIAFYCGIWYFVHLHFVPWSGSLIFVQKKQPYFWPVPYYQHWTWNMDTNVPTRPSCVN